MITYFVIRLFLCLSRNIHSTVLRCGTCR